MDYIIQIRRDKDGKRVVSHVTEISNMEGDKIPMTDIGTFKNGEFKFTGLVPSKFEKQVEVPVFLKTFSSGHNNEQTIFHW